MQSKFLEMVIMDGNTKTIMTFVGGAATGLALAYLKDRRTKQLLESLEIQAHESAKAASLREGSIYYGFDIGGTKMQFSVFNAALEAMQGEPFNQRLPTPQDYDKFLRLIEQCICGADKALGMSHAPVGLSFPGSPSQREENFGCMVCVNVTAVHGKPLQKDLMKKLQGQRDNTTVRINNDANCFALGEALVPELRNSECILGVILGTGVGGGVVVNGEVVTGLSNFAGEFGHFPIPKVSWERLGRPERCDCPCGQAWCVERFLSGSALERRFKERYGEEVLAKDLFKRYDQGDKPSQEHVEEYLDVLAQFLQVLVINFDPRAIVFGGGISNWDGLYRSEGIRNRLKKLLLPTAEVPRLLKHQFGDAGGARGAALLNAHSVGAHL